MNGFSRKRARKPLSPFVRRQVHGPAARLQLMRQRLRRKHMSPGAACAQDRNLVHHYCAGTSIGAVRLGWIATFDRGLVRVSASTNPIDMAIATSDEPP